MTETATYVWINGQQAARLFRSLTLSSCQAEQTCVVWYFDGGLVLRLVDGDQQFRLSVSPVRCAIGAPPLEVPDAS